MKQIAHMLIYAYTLHNALNHACDKIPR